METQLEKIREEQKNSWNTFSPGWKKWDNWLMGFLQPMGYEIIDHLKLKESDVVLDVATGTGEPGLTIAGIVKKGKVIGIDLSEKMLETARENAEKRGLRNFETQVCDVCELPFENETFDAISCRMGFMFFPDMLLAAREMVRVLKHGGRIATTVWGGPAKNFWITSVMIPIMKNLQIPSPPPDAPGMFRCSNPELMTDLFKQAGLKNVIEKEIDDEVEVESIDFFWQYMNDVAAPVVAAMNQADEAMRIKIKNEVFDSLKQKYPENRPAMLDYEAILVYGEK